MFLRPNRLLCTIPVELEVSFLLKYSVLADIERIALLKGVPVADASREQFRKFWIREVIEHADGASLEFFRNQHRYFSINGADRLRMLPRIRIRRCHKCKKWYMIGSILDWCRHCTASTTRQSATQEVEDLD